MEQKSVQKEVVIEAVESFRKTYQDRYLTLTKELDILICQLNKDSKEVVFKRECNVYTFFFQCIKGESDSFDFQLSFKFNSRNDRNDVGCFIF